MKEILDIRFNSKINSDISLLLNKISFEKRLFLMHLLLLSLGYC